VAIVGMSYLFFETMTPKRSKLLESLEEKEEFMDDHVEEENREPIL
jgi:hypothetical protein